MSSKAQPSGALSRGNSSNPRPGQSPFPRRDSPPQPPQRQELLTAVSAAKSSSQTSLKTSLDTSLTTTRPAGPTRARSPPPQSPSGTQYRNNFNQAESRYSSGRDDSIFGFYNYDRTATGPVVRNSISSSRYSEKSGDSEEEEIPRLLSLLPAPSSPALGVRASAEPPPLRTVRAVPQVQSKSQTLPQAQPHRQQTPTPSGTEFRQTGARFIRTGTGSAFTFEARASNSRDNESRGRGGGGGRGGGRGNGNGNENGDTNKESEGDDEDKPRMRVHIDIDNFTTTRATWVFGDGGGGGGGSGFGLLSNNDDKQQFMGGMPFGLPLRGGLGGGGFSLGNLPFGL